MMDELRELYQETILDHKRSPRNFGELATANRTAPPQHPALPAKFRFLPPTSTEQVFERSPWPMSKSS